MKTVEESLYYTMQYVTDTTYDGQGNNKYSPLLDGIYNIKQTVEGTTIGLIPMKPRDDFEFLTYEVFPIAGDISVSIYKCDNYPLCHFNNIDKTKLKKIDNDQSYYYSFNNKHFRLLSYLFQFLHCCRNPELILLCLHQFPLFEWKLTYQYYE